MAAGAVDVREHIGALISLQMVATDGVVEEIVEHIVDEPPPRVLEAAGVTELTVAADMEVTFDAQAPQPWSRASGVGKGPRRRKRRHRPDSEDQLLDEAKKQAEAEELAEPQLQSEKPYGDRARGALDGAPGAKVKSWTMCGKP